MAGITEYEQIGGTIDGVSFVPLLRGKSPADRPEKLRELAQVLTDFLKGAGALLPTDKRTGKHVEYPIAHAGDSFLEKEK